MQNNLSSRKILTYEDLAQVQPGENGEKLVDVRTYDPRIIALYEKKDMHAYTRDAILVRESVARKLANINETLANQQNLRLKVVYGYRHPEVQKRYFDKRKSELKKLKPQLDDVALERLTHNFVAIPSVAGHPTGGAIDATITGSQGEALDMGTRIADYSDPHKIKTFVSSLTDKQISNRKLLHDLMVREGFAPFYGEWWHFSLGDREWAAFYGKKTAHYDAFSYRVNISKK